MEDLCSAANPEPDYEPESDMNSASEFEDSDDDCIIRKRWRERCRPKRLTYTSLCSTNTPGQFSKLQLHPCEIDELQVPVSPGELFKMFFTPELVGCICSWTNVCAESQKELKQELYKDWEPLTQNEFFKFLAVLLFMTYQRVPKICDYWSDDCFYGNSFIPKIMTKLRYRQIQAFLTVSETHPDRHDVDFSEVDSLYECIRQKCLNMWEPEQAHNQETQPLDKVKDAVDFLWEALDAVDETKTKQRKIHIEKTERGQLLLKGFGTIHNVQWKDRLAAGQLMLMHKDIKQGVLKFLRYKIVDKDSEFGAFGLSKEFGTNLDYMMVGENDVLISTTKSWKVVFYHLIDVSWLSSYLLFEQYRTEPEQAFNPHVARSRKYKAIDFMIDLMRDLADIPSDGDKK